MPHPVWVKSCICNYEGHHLCPWEVHNLGLSCFQILLNGKCVAMGISMREMWTDLRARCDSKVWRYFHKPHRSFISLSNHTGYLMIYSNLFLLMGSLAHLPLFLPRFSCSFSHHSSSTSHSIFVYFLGSCLALWNIFSHLPRSAPH